MDRPISPTHGRCMAVELKFQSREKSISDSSDKPIFIVGVPRSGTTLLSAMLSSHSKMECGPETHFFRNLINTKPSSLIDPHNWPETARDFILSISHTNFSNPDRILLIDKYQLTEEEITEYLKKRSPTISSILSSITEQYMRRSGKRRWIEKTPDHIEHVKTIRKYFPKSPIIRIIRDPRDVSLSLQKVPWGVESFVHGLVLWKHLDMSSEDFFSTDPLSYTIRYEDLLTNPRQELLELCEFIGEDFEEDMLNTTNSGKQLNTQSVPWKAKASQPLDRSRIQAWRSELTQFEKKVADSLIGDRISIHSYETGEFLRKTGEIFPSETLVPKYIDEISFLIHDNYKFWKLDDTEEYSALVLLGDPRGDHWLSENHLTSAIQTISIVSKISANKLQRNTIYWIQDDKNREWSGILAFFLRKILNPFRVTRT